MRDGRIEEIGTPEAIYRTPRSDFVAGFVGDLNVIGRQYLRPEVLRLRAASAADEATDAIVGTIAGVTFLGPRMRYRVRSERLDRELVAEIAEAGSDRFRFGDRVVVEWNPGDAMPVCPP
jgi:ABC-type Fe3+/spermidine/putrescine transport system ATPase subunit